MTDRTRTFTYRPARVVACVGVGRPSVAWIANAGLGATSALDRRRER